MPLSYEKEILMKKTVYQILAVIFSLTMLLASCGRESDPAESVSELTTLVTEASTEEPIGTEKMVATDHYATDIVRFCYAENGNAIVMDEDGSLFALPYHLSEGVLYNGSANIFDLSLGDMLRIDHSGSISGGNPGSYSYIFSIEKILDASFYVIEETSGMIVRVSETTIWIHPRPHEVLDPAKVDLAECYELDLRGIPIAREMHHEALLTPSELKTGDFVRVNCRSGAKDFRLTEHTFSVILRPCVTEQLTVTNIYESVESVMFGDVGIHQVYFDNGNVLDLSGQVVRGEDVSIGDLFEVKHNGTIKDGSTPASFGRLYVLRRIKTAEQIKLEEAQQAARDAAEALTKKVVMRGTVRDTGTFKNLVYFGETVAPEEITTHGCTILGDFRAFPITDAATGQALTWDDLRDGDYVAVETDGVIAESAPGQMFTVYSVTRLSRLCLEGTVTAVTSDGVTVACEDGKSRTVSLNQYYVRTVRFDIESLRVGDKVRLDLNALDETEVYALHLIDRKAVIPEGAVTETLLVIQPGNMREIWTVRDLDYDTTQLHWDKETGFLLFDGDAVFSVKNIFHDTDGTVRPVSQLQPGDLITITYSGQLTESEHPCFAEIHQITCVTE